MNIKDVRLTKGMSKNEVNELVSEWVELIDEEFMGSGHRHNWRCLCGKTFIRAWEKIRYYKSINCLDCTKKKKKYRKLILICECCGRLLNKEKHNTINLCNKHHRQLKKEGKFLDENPISI